jgi:quercetin dioxygenase-like cupin family protein
MVPEASAEQTEHGLFPTEGGWFVVNARDVAWRLAEGRGRWPRLEGGRPHFAQLGVGLTVLEPGEPMAMYHWESDQEDFLVLSGEVVLVVEGTERPLRQWDFVHCLPGTNHVIVGAGAGQCVVFRVGSRENHTQRLADGSIDGKDDWGAYRVDDAALRHGAGVEEETTDADVAYGRIPFPEVTRYREGWLPDL